jgi:hypothetical protein
MTPSDLTLEQVHQHFVAWRATKRLASEPIPDSLWQQVFQLMQQYPKSSVLKRLGISTLQFNTKFNPEPALEETHFISLPLALYPLELTLANHLKITLQLPAEQLTPFIRALL